VSGITRDCRCRSEILSNAAMRALACLMPRCNPPFPFSLPPFLFSSSLSIQIPNGRSRSRVRFAPRFVGPLPSRIKPIVARRDAHSACGTTEVYRAVAARTLTEYASRSVKILSRTSGLLSVFWHSSSDRGESKREL